VGSLQASAFPAELSVQGSTGAPGLPGGQLALPPARRHREYPAWLHWSAAHLTHDPGAAGK